MSFFPLLSKKAIHFSSIHQAQLTGNHLLLSKRMVASQTHNIDFQLSIPTTQSQILSGKFPQRTQSQLRKDHSPLSLPQTSNDLKPDLFFMPRKSNRVIQQFAIREGQNIINKSNHR